jgi:tetratricopeptide (TPR) repeat protein
MTAFENPLGEKAHRSIHLVEEGHPLEALKIIEEVLRVSPNDPEFMNIRASALHEAGRSSEALEQMERCLEIKPDDDLYLRNKGLILYDTGDYEEAIRTLEKSYSIDAGNSTTLYLISSSYLELGNNEKAMEFARKALSVDPRDAELHYLLHRIYDYLGDEKRSEKELQSAIKFDPDNIGYRVEYARELFDDDNREKALLELDKLTTKIGSNPDSYGEKISLLLEYDETYEAMKSCDYALRKWPNISEFHYLKGLTLIDQGNYREALHFIDRALEIYHDDGYQETRIQVLGKLGKYAEVIEAVNRNPNLINEPSDIFPTYADAMISQGMTDKSVDMVKENLNKINLEDIMEILGIFAEKGSIENALEICNYWYETAKSKEIPLIAKFTVLFNAGKWNEALQESRSYYDKLTPESSALLRVYMARKLYDIGEYDKAMEEVNTDLPENLDESVKDEAELTRIILDMRINGKDHGIQDLREFAKRVGEIEASAMIWEFLASLESEKDTLLYDTLNEVMPDDDNQ